MKRFALSSKAFRLLFAILFALLLGFLLTMALSDEPLAAYKAFLTGPFSALNRFGDWIEDAITLCFLGVAVSLVFKAKLFSLGAEGQMTLGALAAGLMALYLPLPSFLLLLTAFLAAAAAGFVWGAVPGLLKARLQANEIVSTLMLNFIAVKFYEFMVTYHLTPEGAGFVASPIFKEEGQLSGFLPPLPFLSEVRRLMLQRTSISTGLYIALLAAFGAWFLMYRSTFGYALRTTGLNPEFARYGGISTKRTVFLSMAISGAVAGMAGAHLALGIHGRLLLGVAVGFGFEGVVVSLLAGNNPKNVPWAAVGYAYLRVGADIMERSSDVSREMVFIIQGIIILLVTAERSFPALTDLFGRKKREPIWE